MIAYAIITVVGLKVYAKGNGKAILFYSLSWLCNTIYILMESISIFLKIEILWKLSYTILSSSFIFWMLFIDYAFNDDISWKKFSIGIAYFTVLTFWTWYPTNNVSISFISGTYIIDIPQEFIYAILFDSYMLLFAGTFFYWAFSTYKSVPDNKKKESISMIIAGLVTIIGSILLIFTDFGLFIEMYDLISTLVYLSLISSSIISLIVIYRFPTIMHLLPYEVYELIVMSKGGVPYVQHKWSDKRMETALMTGLFSAITTIKESITDDLEVGRVREMVMENVVFLLESKYSPVTFALVTSKSSRDLKTSLSDFSSNFVKVFYDLLYDENGFIKNVNGNPSEYFKKDVVDDMIGKHFSNVPSLMGVDNE
jgi:hypothetical protein